MPNKMKANRINIILKKKKKKKKKKKIKCALESWHYVTTSEIP